jgi:hypothetical protein
VVVRGVGPAQVERRALEGVALAARRQRAVLAHRADDVVVSFIMVHERAAGDDAVLGRRHELVREEESGRREVRPRFHEDEAVHGDRGEQYGSYEARHTSVGLLVRVLVARRRTGGVWRAATSVGRAITSAFEWLEPNWADLRVYVTPTHSLFDSTLRQLPKGSDSSVNSVREVLRRAVAAGVKAFALAASPHETAREPSIKRRNHSKLTRSQHWHTIRRPRTHLGGAAAPRCHAGPNPRKDRKERRQKHARI